MARIDLIRSPLLVHAEYADASVIAAGSEVVVLAGVCPLDASGATVAPGDLGRQMERTLENLDVALRECGVAITDVANVRISVATQSRSDLSAAWAIFRERYAEHEVPATLVGVTVLGYDDQLVEIEVVAARAAP